MRPILKWPGGKSGELANIRPLIPKHERYIEPFAGGAALFFDLEPESAIINDVNPQLILFYRLLGEQPERLHSSVSGYARARSAIGRFSSKLTPTLYKIYSSQSGELEAAISDGLHTQEASRAWEEGIGREEWLTSERAQLLAAIGASLKSKITRVRDHEIRDGSWSPADISSQIETAIHAGFYTWVRDIHDPVDDFDRTGRFIYLREFSYGGMFRFNRAGRFNVPYGGRSYNGKDFETKLGRIFAPEVTGLLARTKIHCQPFDQFFSDLKLRAGDFIFFDPPYDSQFSDYDQFSFGASEQRQLAEIFTGLSCPALMIIGKSALIEELYKEARERNPSIVIEEYEKTYAYNIRGRNKRDVTHLAIRNFPKP